MRCRGVVPLLAGLLLVSGCSSAGTAAPTSTTTTTAPVTTTRAPTTTTQPADATTGTADTTTSKADEPARAASTPVVVLDPGHNGGNAAAPGEINRQVPAGRGRMKACNTTGTSTEGGYPEHAFNFDVARRVSGILSAGGIRVVSTRSRDDGVGPCVDRRAAIGNEAGADAVVSIHADGATSSGARGFHIAYSSPPLNPAQGEPATRLASTLRTSMSVAGFPVANYLGQDGLSARDDLAGLNLSERPAVLVECGNMRDPGEAAAMTAPGGRQRYATAIARGILTYLGRQRP